MEYTAEIKISGKRDAYLKKALAYPGQMDRDEVYAESVYFEDGMYAVDVKAVGCGDEEPAWTEAVLFKREPGTTSYSELSCTDVGDEFTGEWELYGDGHSFKVAVKADDSPEDTRSPGRNTEWYTLG